MLQGRHKDKAAKSSTFSWHFCFSQLSPTFLHFQTSGTKYYLYWIQLHVLQLKVPACSPKREAGEFSREAVGCSARSGDHCKKGNADFGATGWKCEAPFLHPGAHWRRTWAAHTAQSLGHVFQKSHSRERQYCHHRGHRPPCLILPLQWTLKRGFVFYCILTDGGLCTDVLFRSSNPSLEEQWRQERRKGKET